MGEDATLNNARLFAEHAGKDIAVWKMAEGQRVTHTKLGTGTIMEARDDAKSGPGQILLLIRFHENAEKKFKSETLAEARYFSDMQLPSSVSGIIEQMRARLEAQQRHAQELAKEFLEEKERREKERIEQQEKERERQDKEREQRERERESAAHYADLKKKYGARNYRPDKPSDPLYPILLRIDEGHPLDEEEVRRLENYDLHAALAIDQENEYRRSHEPWTLIKASSHWRLAKDPERALKATEHLLEKHFASGSPKFRSAVLTTKGGALRDLNDLDAAERCAREALKHGPASHYPCNLLGAICWQRGKAEEGDEWFRHAQQLGAQPGDQERMQKRALKVAGARESEAVAEYLLKKDPTRYAWAKHYLPER